MRIGPAGLLLLAVVLPAGAEEKKPATAVARGVAWLRSQQAGDGSWGGLGGGRNMYRYPAGPTSLALFSLLASGVPPDDPQIKRGFAYIESYYRLPGSTYEITFLMLALHAKAPRVKGRLRMKPRDRAWLKALQEQLVANWSGGGWRYGSAMQNPNGLDKDMSHTQFAIHALYAAHEAGLKPPRKVVLDTLLWVLGEQEPKGPARGWAYARKSPVRDETLPSGSMTTGGVATLLLGGRLLEEIDPKSFKKHRRRIREGIADGLMWLALHWTTERNPSTAANSSYQIMYFYGVERVGDYTRRRLLGGHDWFSEGAKWLASNQTQEGKWDRKDVHRPHALINTCFALLFLSRATQPLAPP
ncbi:MAG: prenyltransferase/squalene oxidase repeat-containing protein [Planctomycetota bacterium]|jgi:hypothetical protein